jgi:hypothetical protein
VSRLEERIGTALAWWASAVSARARLVFGLILAITAVSGFYAATELGVNTEYKQLLPADLPVRQIWDSFSEQFPTLNESLLVVVDGETPELARDAGLQLAERLHARRDVFTEVFVPGEGDFFARNGLLYRSPEELDALIDRMAEVQPILAEMTVDPSISNLARLIQLGLDQADSETAVRDWPAVLDRVSHATVAVYDEYPLRVSWEDVLLGGSAIDPSSRTVIIAEPILDYASVFSAKASIAAIREAAADLEGPASGVRVRVTGNPALNYEEMRGLIRDVAVAGVVSALAICGILYLALRSSRLMFTSVITLVIGLVWTAAFATFAIGRINLVSIAFAVLFVGLGIDFAIHLGVHYEDLRRRGLEHGDSIREALRRVGSALTICTLTTATGFFAFVPTDFRGAGELGLISGTGMFVIFFLTVTLYPALLQLWVAGKQDWPRVSKPFHLPGLAAAERHPRATLGVAAVLGIASVFAFPQLRFYSDVVKMRDPQTESVKAFLDLQESVATTPWQADLREPDLASAQALAARLREQPEVDRAVTLADYVPADQEEKIEILEDLALLLDMPRARSQREPLPAAEQVEALRELHDYLDKEWLQRSPSHLASSALHLRTRLGEFLVRVEDDPRPDEALASLEEILLGGLPDQLARLQRATQPELFGIEDLPLQIRRRMLAADGTARVQVFPSEDAGDSETLVRFVDAVQEVKPIATGMAPNLVELGRATSRSFRTALMLSMFFITALLIALWRKPIEVAMALAPLFLGASLTAATMWMMGMTFNFINLIVIPLLLGIGVDSGIHLVHRGLHIQGDGEKLTESQTARAVFYSALTTIASFGSLALSAHRGLAGMGILLVCGMVFMLNSNLLVLPALIRIYRTRRGE